MRSSLAATFRAARSVNPHTLNTSEAYLLSRTFQPIYGSVASIFEAGGWSVDICDFVSSSCEAFLSVATFFAKSLNDVLAFHFWLPGYPAACEL